MSADNAMTSRKLGKNTYVAPTCLSLRNDAEKR